MIAMVVAMNAAVATAREERGVAYDDDDEDDDDAAADIDMMLLLIANVPEERRMR
jgi:hypothetical protein